jgi:hypothetical protein
MDFKINCLDSGHFEDGERLREIDQLVLHLLENFDCKRSTCRKPCVYLSSCHQGGKAHRAYQTNLWRWSELFQRFCRKRVAAKALTSQTLNPLHLDEIRTPVGWWSDSTYHDIPAKQHPPSLLTGAVDLPRGSQSRDLRILG